MRRDTRRLMVTLLMDGRPRTQREIANELGLSKVLVNAALFRAWEKGAVVRTKEVYFDQISLPRGPKGLKTNVRAFHKYTVLPADFTQSEQKVSPEVFVKDGVTFVGYSREYYDHRSSRHSLGEKSKSKLVIDFLKENSKTAWFSTQVRERLKEKGVRVPDVMMSVRRYAKKGWVLVRGYNTDVNSTPFREGYLLTWIDQDKSQQQAVIEAFKRTEEALDQASIAIPINQRIHRLRGLLIEAAATKDLISPLYLKNQLKCTDDELEIAIRRARQLYPDVKEEKLFGAYRYFYHSSISPEELHASIEMKKNYIRMTKGRESRVGHNWEAACEFFVDKFTLGASFWTQAHRVSSSKMDPRRITLHLMKPVGHRLNNAEVDRVWEVCAGIFSPKATYVLECKWGLVMKKYIDDFFEVLRWSKEFGADSQSSPDGRAVKQGIVGVFAGSTFNPRETVVLKDGKRLSLPSYAARNNITILKAVDFNKKLQEQGVPKECTVQKICRVARDESNTRHLLEEVWSHPSNAKDILLRALDENKDVFDLESLLLNNEAQEPIEEKIEEIQDVVPVASPQPLH
jgi:hypothetical protein